MRYGVRVLFSHGDQSACAYANVESFILLGHEYNRSSPFFPVGSVMYVVSIVSISTFSGSRVLVSALYDA